MNNRTIIKQSEGNFTISDTNDNCKTIVKQWLYSHYCLSCGKSTRDMESYETGYNERTVYNQCTCGKKVIYRG